MPYQTEKHAIRAAFEQATPHYDNFAVVQRRIVEALVAQLPPDSAGTALDAGAGTACLARTMRARQPALHFIALDLAEGMLRARGLPAVGGDIESLPFAGGCFDLYTSSLAWQWVHADAALAEAWRVLRPGGQLLVATLGENTLSELRHAYAAADQDEHVRQLQPAASLAQALSLHPWRDIQISRQNFIEYAPSVRSLIHSIRSLGAGVLPSRRKSLFGKQAWQRMEQAYEMLRCADGLPLTYDVIFLSARKPS